MVVTLTIFSATTVMQAQDAKGPIAPPPKFEVKAIPVKTDPGKPPLPPEEIIRRFAAKEDEFKRAYHTYGFDQTVRVQEIDENGKPAGEFEVTGKLFVKPDGERYERITNQPVSTLKRTAFSLEDVRILAQFPLFVLTTDELSHYTLQYQGEEKLDELQTYIFLVKPKQVERKRRFFDGVVWVDDHDMAIVKSYGQFVTEVSGEGSPLPFKLFETYRENISKYWFPTYTRSDDIETTAKSELHLRLVMRSTGFEPLRAPDAPLATPGTPAIPAAPKPPSAPSH